MVFMYGVESSVYGVGGMPVTTLTLSTKTVAPKDALENANANISFFIILCVCVERETDHSSSNG